QRQVVEARALLIVARAGQARAAILAQPDRRGLAQWVPRIVHRNRIAALVGDQAHGRYVGVAVAEIDDAVEGDRAALFAQDLVDGDVVPLLQGPFVDPEEELGLGGVVDAQRHADRIQLGVEYEGRGVDPLEVAGD